MTKELIERLHTAMDDNAFEETNCLLQDAVESIEALQAQVSELKASLAAGRIKELIDTLRSAGADGDAAYCWNLCTKAADTIEALQAQVKSDAAAYHLVCVERAQRGAECDKLAAELANYRAQQHGYDNIDLTMSVQVDGKLLACKQFISLKRWKLSELPQAILEEAVQNLYQELVESLSTGKA